MKGIYLNMQEETKYEIVKSFVDNKSINFKNLALKLNSSLKQLIISLKNTKKKAKQGSFI